MDAGQQHATSEMCLDAERRLLVLWVLYLVTAQNDDARGAPRRPAGSEQSIEEGLFCSYRLGRPLQQQRRAGCADGSLRTTSLLSSGQSS